MRVIFLDIDGVLVNHRSWYVRSGNQATADPQCVDALNFITAATGASIVVSSTWRIGQTVVAMREILNGQWKVTGKIIDLTPVLHTHRGVEISMWLRNYKRHDIDSFVILDDDSDMHPHMDRLVQTLFDEGLKMEHANKAIRMLETFTTV